ncbi:sialidase-3-like [Pogona vitticeps]
MVDSLASFGKVVLFRQKKRGGLTYRIPALLYLPSESTFLAFAEERSSPRDEDAQFLVMRRGRKDGKTVKWGPQTSLTTAALPKYRTMNPCPVHEKRSGTVFLFFICVLDHVSVRHQITTGRNAARLCYVSSQDGGRTWSPLTDLTDQTIGDDLRNWATFAVGPGHGVQLRSGRLVVPAYAYHIRRRCFSCVSLCCTKPHCFTFYSDNGGQNWAQGQLLEKLRTTESQVAEVICPDDSQVLYINARNPRWDGCRAEAFSTDDGHHFQESFLCQELCEPPNGCQGSIVSFAPQPASSDRDRKEDVGEQPHLLGLCPSAVSLGNTTSWLVFSHPTSRHRRMDLGIYLNTSPLKKGSWGKPWVLNKGPSGYSDLAVCQEGHSLMFGCLFECGVSSACEEIAFRLFTHVELLRHTREGSSLAEVPSDSHLS